MDMTDIDRPALREKMAGVMGWKDSCDEDTQQRMWVRKNPIDGEDDFVMFQKLWNPLTDLNQAFMLSRKMAERGWRMFIISPDIIEPNKTSVGFTKSSWPFSYLKDANPATAICLAVEEAMKESCWR